MAKNKSIVLDRYTLPDILGYQDKFSIIGKDDQILLHGFCSTNPNARMPISKGGKPWQESYALIACTHPDAPLWGQIVPNHDRYKRCILINAGGPIPTVYPNPNTKSKYYGQYLAGEIFIHCGFSDESTPAGRGSSGCITLPSHMYKLFMNQFKTDEIINIFISDKTNFTAKGKQQ